MENKKGFTLLELLVVVLIIGILAAIALPQYKMAVAKSEYNTLKNMTESLAQSVERYYLNTNTPPTNLEDLDIDMEGEYLQEQRSALKQEKNYQQGKYAVLMHQSVQN